MLVRIGRYGPMVQIGQPEEGSDEKPTYASLPRDKMIDTISLDEALDCFKLPRVVGEYEGKEIVAAIGRFGPYLKFSNQGKDAFVSIKKDSGLEPLSITLEEAIPLVQEKITLDANKYINEFTHEKEKIEILNGPYGPYLKYKKKNYKIPKGGKDATDLTLDDCLILIEEGTS